MNKSLLNKWARPLFDGFAEILRTVGDTPGDASMLNAVEGLIAGLPVPDWTALADDMALDMEDAAGKELTALVDRLTRTAAFAAENPGFHPLADAIAKLERKTPVASKLRTEEWARMPLALRERAQLSSGVESVRVMANIQAKLEARVGHYRELLANGKEAYVSRDSFIRDIRQIALDEGLDTGKGNVLTNIAAPRRIGLIYDMQNQQAAGYARWKLDNDADALAILPAWRLGGSTAKTPRSTSEWMARWTEAGMSVGWIGASASEMVALKTSPIWRALSRFGTPWPPFDFGSTRELEDVWRDEAERLGLVEPDERLEPTAGKDFNDALEASASEISAPQMRYLQDSFGDQVQWKKDEQRIVWQGNLIGDLVGKAISDPQFKDHVNLGLATNAAMRKAKEAGVPVDLEGMKMYLTADDVRKINKDHGPGNEIDGRQRPITRLDYEVIPHVWRDPDEVLSGTRIQKPKENTVEMLKEIMGKHWVVGWNRDVKSNVMFVNTAYVRMRE